MKLLDLNVKDSINAMHEAYKNNEDILIKCIADEIIIGHGNDDTLYNKQYCIDNNFAMYNTGCDNGACVAVIGDLHFLECHKGFSDIGLRILQCIKEYLEDNLLDAEIIGNDLIIHGDNDYKVGSYASVWAKNDELVLTVVHLSINLDLELINTICNKPIEKVPKALIDYGISSEDVLEYLKDNMDDFRDLEI